MFLEIFRKRFCDITSHCLHFVMLLEQISAARSVICWLHVALSSSDQLLSHSVYQGELETTKGDQRCLSVLPCNSSPFLFSQPDATATIYFITQFCAASIRERRMLNSVNRDGTDDEEIHCLKGGGVAADARESI